MTDENPYWSTANKFVVLPPVRRKKSWLGSLVRHSALLASR